MARLIIRLRLFKPCCTERELLRPVSHRGLKKGARNNFSFGFDSSFDIDNAGCVKEHLMAILLPTNRLLL